MISTILFFVALAALVPELVMALLGAIPVAQGISARSRALTASGLTGAVILVAFVLVDVLIAPGALALGVGIAAGAAWLAWHFFFPSGRAVVARWAVLVSALVSLALVPSAHAKVGPRFLAVWGILLLVTLPANDLVGEVFALVKPNLHSNRTDEGDSSSPRPGGLKGGRWIGPLERLLILALAGADANVAVGTVIAAKGIIRFPEISKDETGDKAEEFLIGSLISWTLAVLAAMVLHLFRPA